MNRALFAIALLVPLSAFSQQPARQADVQVQKTSLSRDQELQLGKQAASQVEREMEVVHNPEIEKWLEPDRSEPGQNA